MQSTHVFESDPELQARICSVVVAAKDLQISRLGACQLP